MTDNVKERMREVKSILVSQPEPNDENSPYFKLATKFGIKVDFRAFIHVEKVPAKDFRKQKINILDHTAVIFTSRNAVDHFFGMCKEMKIEVPSEMKYFCISEQTAYYLQKYIVVRKRKLFTGEKTAQDLLPLIKKHKNENFLYPCSDIRKDTIPAYMEEAGVKFSEAVLYKTVASDLSDLKDIKYDILKTFEI